MRGPTPLLGIEDAAGDVYMKKDTTNDVTTWSVESTTTASLVHRFTDAAEQARTTPADADKQLEFAKAGANVVNLRCMLFFDDLSEYARGAGYTLRTVDILTDTLTAVLATSGIHEKTIAGIATGGAFFSAGGRDFSDTYFLSPDTAFVEKLVADAHNAALDKFEKNAGKRTFDTVIGFLISYQAICQPHMIKDLINSAVASGKPVPKFGAQDALDELEEAKISLAVVAFEQSIGLQNVSREEIVITLWVRAQGGDKNRLQFACGKLSVLRQKVFGAATCPAEPKSKISDDVALSKSLEGLVRANSGFWEQLVKKMESNYVAANPKPKNPDGTPTPSFDASQLLPLNVDVEVPTTTQGSGANGGFTMEVR